jgi:hypothetical protein
MYPPLLCAAMLENPNNDTHVPGWGSKVHRALQHPRCERISRGFTPQNTALFPLVFPQKTYSPLAPLKPLTQLNQLSPELEFNFANA